MDLTSHIARDPQEKVGPKEISQTAVEEEEREKEKEKKRKRSGPRGFPLFFLNLLCIFWNQHKSHSSTSAFPL